MKYRVLGKTDYFVSEIDLGGWATGIVQGSRMMAPHQEPTVSIISSRKEVNQLIKGKKG